jgi:hypothetical protein
MMKLFLVDQQPDLIECWRREFEGFPEVAILLGDILCVAENSMVLPGNTASLVCILNILASKSNIEC